MNIVQAMCPVCGAFMTNRETHINPHDSEEPKHVEYHAKYVCDTCGVHTTIKHKIPARLV